MGLHPLRVVAPRRRAYPVDGLDGGVDGGHRRGLVVLVLRGLLPPSHLRGHSLAGECLYCWLMEKHGNINNVSLAGLLPKSAVEQICCHCWNSFVPRCFRLYHNGRPACLDWGNCQGKWNLSLNEDVISPAPHNLILPPSGHQLERDGLLSHAQRNASHSKRWHENDSANGPKISNARVS